MPSATLPRPLRGIVPPLITPLVEQETLDAEGLERIILRMLDAGVNGIFTLGTTGEAPGLSYRLRREVVERVCRIVSGRVPVLVGITDTSLTEALNMACKAAEEGAQAVVYGGPFYYPVSQAELIRHLDTLASLSPLPIYLYNIPAHTRVSFEIPTVRELAGHPRILGFKDSSGDLMYFQRVIEAVRDRPDFAVLMGPEEMLADALMEGAHGGVSGGANLFPSLFVKLYEAAIAHSYDEMMRLHRIVLELHNRIYTASSGYAGFLKGIKCALALEGISSGAMAEPYRPLEGEVRESIAEALRYFRRLGL